MSIKFFVRTILLFSIIFIYTANAQWVQANGPYGGRIQSLLVAGSNIFAGTGEGVYLSTNNGVSWTTVNSGLSNLYIYALAAIDKNIFAGTLGGWNLYLDR
jgi:hypothetical protein